MSDRSRKDAVSLQSVVGVDLGDRWAHGYALSVSSGEEVGRSRFRVSPRGLEREFGSRERMRIVIEVGTHSSWVARELEGMGHEVIVADARQVRLISGSPRKSDRVDAQVLARLGRVDPQLLSPIRHRSASVQRDRSLLHAREALVTCRTRLINHLRSLVKVHGCRLRGCSSPSFAREAGKQLPTELQEIAAPILETLAVLTDRIRAYDALLDQRAREVYPVTECLRQVRGVGVLTSVAYVTTLEDPSRFAKSREVGPYVGLVPRRDQSGDWDPQLGITKRGDKLLRKLLIQAAHHILGPFGEDSDLRRYGERIQSRGGKHAKKRAVVAVARKLAVLLHHLWVTGEEYEPLYASRRCEQSAA